MRPFVALLLVCIAWAALGYDCGNDKLTDADRDAILKVHNDYRSELAQGQSTIKGGTKASKAKNMYKLKYSCDVEKKAQEWIDNCKFIHSSGAFRKYPKQAGENLFMVGSEKITTADTVVKAAHAWWSELEKKGGITSNNVTLTTTAFEAGIGHWSQMAWATTTELGCGLARCKGSTMVACHYVDVGNVISFDIYEMGEPCGDGSCKSFNASTCDSASGLCMLPNYAAFADNSAITIILYVVCVVATRLVILP